MITAELIHNPYLLQTSVKFNGQPPRINSQIEKYEHTMLKEWIDRVPKIFYDEMNGYDFEFNFVGTKSDFISLQESFFRVGVTGDMVRLFHKNEIEDAETKSAAVDALVRWLRSNPNRKFDFEVFYAQNKDFFDGAYPYIIINGPVAENFHPQVSMEYIESSNQLQNTDLTNTPILIFVDPFSRKQARDDLKQLLIRPDVKQNQLFFMVHPRLDVEQVTRVIMDLGVEKPQVVSSYDAESVMMYIRDYPVTEFVRSAIEMLNRRISDISMVLDVENKESELQNTEIHAAIDQIEAQIYLLKESDNHFTERDNINVESPFLSAQNALQEKIMKWRSWKTKIVGDEECAVAAREYNEDISRNLGMFCSSAKEVYENIASDIYADFSRQYMKQGLDIEYAPEGITLREPPSCPVISIADDLIEMKEITFVEAKHDLKVLFRMGNTLEEREPTRVATCYYARWRERALDRVTAIAEEYVRALIEALDSYYNALANAFHKHLSELIQLQEDEKDRVSAQLSDDERRLQEDNDWLADFKEQLVHIERD